MKPRTKKAWAIIGKGRKIVTYHKAIRPLLIFDRKFRADAAVEDGERVIPVTIVYGCK